MLPRYVSQYAERYLYKQQVELPPADVFIVLRGPDHFRTTTATSRRPLATGGMKMHVIAWWSVPRLLLLDDPLGAHQYQIQVRYRGPTLGGLKVQGIVACLYL